MPDLETRLKSALSRDFDHVEAPDLTPDLLRRAGSRRVRNLAGAALIAVVVAGLFIGALATLAPLASRHDRPADRPTSVPSTPADAPFQSMQTGPDSGVRNVHVLTWGDDPTIGPWLVSADENMMGHTPEGWGVVEHGHVELWFETSYTKPSGEVVADGAWNLETNVDPGRAFNVRAECFPCDSSDERFPVFLLGSASGDVARIRVTLVDGRVLDVPLVALPDELADGTNAASAFAARINPSTGSWVGGTVEALDADGAVLDRYEFSSGSSGMILPFDPITWRDLSPAESDAADALRVVLYDLADRHERTGTFEGWDPLAAGALETVWDDRTTRISLDSSATSTEGTVSVRLTDGDSVVVATRLPDGGVMCAATASGNLASLTMGRTDATSPGDCTGGW